MMKRPGGCTKSRLFVSCAMLYDDCPCGPPGPAEVRPRRHCSPRLLSSASGCGNWSSAHTTKTAEVSWEGLLASRASDGLALRSTSYAPACGCAVLKVEASNFLAMALPTLIGRPARAGLPANLDALQIWRRPMGRPNSLPAATSAALRPLHWPSSVRLDPDPDAVSRAVRFEFREA